jgi:hypothetical protein
MMRQMKPQSAKRLNLWIFRNGYRLGMDPANRMRGLRGGCSPVGQETEAP